MNFEIKNVIITGANGLVATNLTRNLLEKTEARIYLISTNTKKLREKYNNERISYFTLEDFSIFIQNNQIFYDVCVHTAFSRSTEGYLIAQSLDYQKKLIKILKNTNLKCFVNISSQSVYGKVSEPLWTEDTPLDPDYLYAMGKYASEMVTELMLDGTNIQWTNIRLSSVSRNARFIRVFVQNAIEGKPIHLTASDQHCSFIDIRDVADGLLAVIDMANGIKLEHTYNLGANIINSVGDIAQRVKWIGEEKYGLKNVVITHEPSDNHIRIGMDASHFMKTFNWKPNFGMNDMIESMFDILMHTDIKKNQENV